MTVRFPSKPRGFTVLELMITMGFMFILVGSFYGALHVMRNEIAGQRVYFDTDNAVRYGLERIEEDTREALGIVGTWGGNTTGDVVLILKLPSINAGGQPTDIGTQFDYVTYKRDSANPTLLVRSLDVLGGVSTREGGVDVAHRVLVKRIQSLLFSYNGTGLSSVSASTLPSLKYVNVKIVAQGVTLGSGQSTQSSTDLVLRNNVS